MIKFKCRCSRGSLSEHINEIIAKYECPESCSRPIIPSLPAPRSKTTMCPSLLPPTCITLGIRSPEPSSMKLCPSSRLQACSPTCSSTQKPSSSRQRHSPPLPPIRPGPNLKCYLASKAISPSLKGRVPLYNDDFLQSQVTETSRKSLSSSYSTPCYLEYCESSRFYKKNNKKKPVVFHSAMQRSSHRETNKCLRNIIQNTCTTLKSKSFFTRKESDFRIPATTCREICSDLTMPVSTCCRKQRRLEPPFSSKNLESQFKSRFIRIEGCSCDPSVNVND